MEHNDKIPFVEFDCPAEPLKEGTPAAPRPASRPRRVLPDADDNPPSFQSFDCEAIDLPPDLKAVPRPPNAPRVLSREDPTSPPGSSS